MGSEEEENLIDPDGGRGSVCPMLACIGLEGGVQQGCGGWAELDEAWGGEEQGEAREDKPGDGGDAARELWLERQADAGQAEEGECKECEECEVGPGASADQASRGEDGEIPMEPDMVFGKGAAKQQGDAVVREMVEECIDIFSEDRVGEVLIGAWGEFADDEHQGGGGEGEGDGEPLTGGGGGGEVGGEDEDGGEAEDEVARADGVAAVPAVEGCVEEKPCEEPAAEEEEVASALRTVFPELADSREGEEQDGGGPEESALESDEEAQ
jgi:hypothetical protein